MNSKVRINFATYNDPNFSSKAQLILASMNGNAAFPAPVPALSVVADAASNYLTALNAAATGSRSDIADKDIKRAELTALLRILAGYINFAAGGDRSILLTTGYDVSKIPVPVIITKPTGIKIINGGNSGELIVSVKAVKGARSYQYEYTTDASMVDGSWIAIARSTRKNTFRNLEKGKTYYCRVAAVGRKGQVIYSDIVSRVAQ
jgi:hypothetical protein